MAHNVAHVGRRQAESDCFDETLDVPRSHSPVDVHTAPPGRAVPAGQRPAGPALARTSAYGAQGQPQMNLPRTEMHIGMYRIDAQVAHTYDTRQTGLMFRQSMPSQKLRHAVCLFPARRALLDAQHRAAGRQPSSWPTTAPS
jgi:hypothetical protein